MSNTIIKNKWYPIPGFPGYKISGEGVAYRPDGTPLRLRKGGYCLYRNRTTRYFQPARLLYASLHNIDPAELVDAVVVNVNGILVAMTRTEYIRWAGYRKKRGMLNVEEAIAYYRENMNFSEMILRYYETKDLTDVAKYIARYEHSVKKYIYKQGYSQNEDMINEAWSTIYAEILSRITEGTIAIIDPRTYLFKCVRTYFARIRESKRHIVTYRYD